MQIRLLSIAILLLFSKLISAQTLKVASYNIRLETSGDVGNLWQDRKAPLTALVQYHDFEIFGIQEGFIHQIKDMLQLLPEYAYIGVGRDDGAEQGEHSAIFYRKDLFEVHKQGTFWLSGTDTQHPNKGWDAVLPRICTWGIFKDKRNGKSFIFMNTHFDHIGKEARKQSADLILAKAKEFAADLPLILSGDFNIDQHNDAYKVLANSHVVQDAYIIAKHKYALNSTFNNFGKSITADERIDHIFVTPNFKVIKYGILTDTYMGKYPSDHFPVSAELQW